MMTPRRSSTAITDVGPSRISFASAEALLWGPEMRNQHEWLLTKMQALQSEHEAYDARIQSTEAAAEAAEAATSRIRHIEQQLAAMEAEDQDKVFERWAAEEMTHLKIFVDRNQHVRQKQIELEKAVSHVSDDLAKIRDVPVDVKSLLCRLELLEAGRKEDTNRIKSLGKDLANLKTMRQNSGLSNVSSRANLNRSQGSSKAAAPPRVQDAELSDATTETEDEALVAQRGSTGEQVQVPRSPDIRTNANPPATQLVNQERQHGAPVPAEELEARPRPVHTPKPPAMQLVNRANPRKRKQPDDEPQTQRLTRSQAKKSQERGSEQRGASGPGKIASIGPIQLVDRGPASYKKARITPVQRPARGMNTSGAPAQHATTIPLKTRKPSVVAGSSKNTITKPNQPTQLITASPSKPKRAKAAMAPGKKTVPGPARSKVASPIKQKQLIVVLPNWPTVSPITDDDHDDLQMSAADRVKTSPRRAANPSPFNVLPKPSSTRKKNVQSNVDVGPSAYDSSSRTVSPDKPATSVRSESTALPPPSMTTISRRRQIPDVPDYDTFLRLQANKTIT
ncbi:hypothetical protein EJ02DRAFT_402057 [Clathrospora elynae]|uniref:Uncharacterized protein n=1 Tax=Clathrospora elynae TaxID=706981 RepID=A0A6A5SR64_9PLEO|nr:hypothetical protein EJ02DRAFT_402057 [Clathrospora elynae]